MGTQTQRIDTLDLSILLTKVLNPATPEPEVRPTMDSSVKSYRSAHQQRTALDDILAHYKESYQSMSQARGCPALPRDRHTLPTILDHK
jgi:hypothetical protein